MLATLTRIATTGRHDTAITYHHMHEDGTRKASISRSKRGTEWMFVCTIVWVERGDYRDRSHTRSATLLKTEDGWVVREEGWSRNIGRGPEPEPDEWETVFAGPFATKTAAEDFFVERCLDERPIEGRDRKRLREMFAARKQH